MVSIMAETLSIMVSIMAKTLSIMVPIMALKVSITVSIMVTHYRAGGCQNAFFSFHYRA